MTPQPRAAQLADAYGNGLASGRRGDREPGHVAAPADPERWQAWSDGYNDGRAEYLAAQGAPPPPAPPPPQSPAPQPAAASQALAVAGLLLGVASLGVGVVALLRHRRRGRRRDEDCQAALAACNAGTEAAVETEAQAWRDSQQKLYHDILGVEDGAPLREVKSAYRSLARELHPDATGGDQAKARRFRAVREAYRDIELDDMEE